MKQRQARAVELRLRNDIVKRWEHRPVTDITQANVKEVINATIDRGARHQAQNLLDDCRRLFDWAFDEGQYGLEASPCDRLKAKKLVGELPFRDRVLADEELARLLGCDRIDGLPFRGLVSAALIVGAAQV